jgi:hypothetical protein
MSVDSIAVFRARVVAMNLESFWDNFVATGWTTYGSLAFSCSYIPGSSDAEFVAVVIPAITGTTTSPFDATIRRLHFEAYTITMADMQRRASRVEIDDKPPTLPVQERADRFQMLRDKYVGLLLEGELEPSDALTDKFCEMQDRGALKYLSWAELTKRDLELDGVKKDSSFKPDKQGFLRCSLGPLETLADTSSDFKFEKAMMRRGLAMEMAQLLSFNVHELLVRWMLQEYHREALPGYSRVSLDQLQRLDREVFRRLAEVTRGGLGLASDGSLPLDPIMPVVILEPRIVMFLNPLPRLAGPHAGVPRQHEQSSNNGGSINGPAKKRQKGGGDFSKSSGISPPPEGHLAGGKGARGKGKSQRMPQELHGLSANFEGRPCCYDFNMAKGCQNVVDSSARCSRGYHICMKCGGNHAQHSAQCPKK